MWLFPYAKCAIGCCTLTRKTDHVFKFSSLELFVCDGRSLQLKYQSIVFNNDKKTSIYKAQNKIRISSVRKFFKKEIVGNEEISSHLYRKKPCDLSWSVQVESFALYYLGKAIWMIFPLESNIWFIWSYPGNGFNDVWFREVCYGHLLFREERIVVCCLRECMFRMQMVSSAFFVGKGWAYDPHTRHCLSLVLWWSSKILN